MFVGSQYQKSMAWRMSNTLGGILLVLMASGRVTVLLFFVAVSGIVRADDANQPNLRLFEFTSDFYMPMGRGRFDGLMVSDGSQHRIAIYWIEPAVFRDYTFFLGCSDFIFTREQVHYWIYGMSQPANFNLSDNTTDPLLPRGVSPESVARSALSIVGRIRSQPEQTETRLQVGTFFQQSRDKADYSYEVPSSKTSGKEASESAASDVEILNTLPYGRKYSKETGSDGTLVWRAQRVLDGPRVATVTVKPVPSTETDTAASDFDPNTLGRWTRIPVPYQAFWSFDQLYSKLKDEPNHAMPNRELHDKIETYLAKNKVPDRIALAFNQLLFKTSLLTGDTDCVRRSAHAVVAALCRDVSVNNYQALLELARIDVQIRERYTQQADNLICPLIGLMVRRAGTDAPGNLEKLMPAINSNKWFAFGKLLAEEIRVQGLAEEDDTDSPVASLEASRLAAELPPYDPCQASASVKQYMAQLDDDPPKGTLTLDDIRDILQKGLAKPFADANLELKPELIEDIIRSIRLVAGKGPFRGDPNKLIESVRRFSGLYLVVFRYQEPIDTVLATFLALSFCDTSTEEDHDVLFSQICRLCAEFQSLTNTMLTERGLGELVTPADVERLFTRYKERFRQYIDDPLWPPFKYPLTASEETMLGNKLRLHFDQLDPWFEEMALKVKYGGVSDELKTKTRYEIARAVQQLLPETAFLRNPPYPGVSCRFRGAGYGFTAVIRGPLYIEGDRPREKFKAMRYFHLGHRLEQVVIQERELEHDKSRESGGD